ncbi:MAG: hypothetical protein WAN10_18200 [Candidatus Acidiferrales bacterium]
MKGLFIAAILLLSIAVWPDVGLMVNRAPSLAKSSAQAYDARTDFAVLPLPTPLPNIGAARGAGNSILDPDFGTRIYRLTDIDTSPGARSPGQQEWHMNCGGWGDSRVSNLDSTKIFICNGGASAFLLPFDPLTGKAGSARLIPGIMGSPEWSKTEKDAAFGISQSKDPQIVRLDFSVSPPRTTLVVDLAEARNCAEQFAGASVWKEFSAAWDDRTFAMAVGSGSQGDAHLVYVWNATTGCQAYDTEDETVNGVKVRGTTPTDRFFVHSIKISGDGQVVMISPAGNTDLRRFWHVGTTEVDAPESDVDYGHFAMGYSSLVNTTGRTSDGKWCKLGMGVRLLTALSSIDRVLTSEQCGNTLAKGDNHVSWNNDDSTDRRPFATSTVTIPLGSPIMAPWQDEILVFTRDGAVHREAHTFNSGKSNFFACQNAIGSISQDGKWFFFSSDWEGTLGTDNAGNQRCDDFAAALH